MTTVESHPIKHGTVIKQQAVNNYNYFLKVICPSREGPLQPHYYRVKVMGLGYGDGTNCAITQKDRIVPNWYIRLKDGKNSIQSIYCYPQIACLKVTI